MVNLQNRNRLTDIENGLLIAKGEGCEGGMDCEFGVSRCKLVYPWMENEVPLCSTRSNIQYPGINHKGREHKKQCIYKYKGIKI